MQFLVDESYQHAEFGARRIDLFAVAHMPGDDELLEARVCAVHLANARDVIACLQCERFRGVLKRARGRAADLAMNDLQELASKSFFELLNPITPSRGMTGASMDIGLSPSVAANA